MVWVVDVKATVLCRCVFIDLFPSICVLYRHWSTSFTLPPCTYQQLGWFSLCVHPTVSPRVQHRWGYQLQSSFAPGKLGPSWRLKGWHSESWIEHDTTTHPKAKWCMVHTWSRIDVSKCVHPPFFRLGTGWGCPTVSGSFPSFSPSK